jgi:hypothetical protein
MQMKGKWILDKDNENILKLITMLPLVIGMSFYILLAWVASNDTKNYFSPRNGLDNYPHDLTLTQKDWTENPMHSSLILVVHIGTGSIYSYGKNQGDHLH